jgi:molybdopterin/thiamine biosynthesis adenylyltransferase
MMEAPRIAKSKANLSGRYVVIGLGGIGGLVLRLLAPFLHSSDGRRATVVAIDGDSFVEAENRDRQLFRASGPKALVLAQEIVELYGDRITVLPVPRYITSRNAGDLIGEGDIVFCQPDNYATRRIVERRCSRLREVALFSGGNDGIENGKTGTYGNVQVYLRSRGRDLTNPLSRFHPELAKPADRVPNARGCAAAATSSPQLLFTNASVAAAMLGAFYAWRNGALDYEEAYLDILSGRMVPVRRELGRPGKITRNRNVGLTGNRRAQGRHRGS